MSIISEAIKKNLGIELTPLQDSQMQQFCDFLLSENEKYNLTAIKDPIKAAYLHFADSLTISKYLESGKTVADIGAGGGFPSIPLAILRSDLQFNPIDATEKKVNFINTAASLLGLSNVKAINGRAEELFAPSSPLRESFDYVTARAVADLGILSEFCVPACRIGGKFIAMKGDNASVELSGYEKSSSLLGVKLEAVEKICITGIEEPCERNIVIFDKIAACSQKYPRAFGQIKKKPLF